MTGVFLVESVKAEFMPIFSMVRKQLSVVTGCAALETSSSGSVNSQFAHYRPYVSRSRARIGTEELFSHGNNVCQKSRQIQALHDEQSFSRDIKIFTNLMKSPRQKLPTWRGHRKIDMIDIDSLGD